MKLVLRAPFHPGPVTRNVASLDEALSELPGAVGRFQVATMTLPTGKLTATRDMGSTAWRAVIEFKDGRLPIMYSIEKDGTRTQVSEIALSVPFAN